MISTDFELYPAPERARARLAMLRREQYNHSESSEKESSESSMASQIVPRVSGGNCDCTAAVRQNAPFNEHASWSRAERRARLRRGAAARAGRG